MGGEMDFAKSFWGEEIITAIDLLVSSSLSPGPEHTELTCVFHIIFPAKSASPASVY